MTRRVDIAASINESFRFLWYVYWRAANGNRTQMTVNVKRRCNSLRYIP